MDETHDLISTNFSIKMKLTTYSAASVLALAGCVWHGAGLHPQFYALCIYLSNNNLCLMLLLNAAVLAMLWLAKAVQYVFIGPLRVIEVEVRLGYVIVSLLIVISISTYTKEAGLR